MSPGRSFIPIALVLLLGASAAATPITPNTNLSGTVHDGESHAGVDGSNSDLSLASFVGTTLSSVASASTFLSTDFSGANFTSANLRNGNYTGADFTGATFSGTQMRDANYTNAIFDGVALNGEVRGANFSGASFLGADLTNATNWGLASWTGALFDASTVFAAGMDPVAEGMVFVAEPHAAVLLALGLLGLGLFGRNRAS
jgi:uncharacterized protein YjbI with pentapeptide repeats